MPRSCLMQRNSFSQSTVSGQAQRSIHFQNAVLPEEIYFGPYCMQVASLEHLNTTLAFLRPEDAAEAQYLENIAGGERTAQQLVYESFHHSPVRYALLRGQHTLGVGGLCPLAQAPPTQGPPPGGAQEWWVPWMVGTVNLNRFPGGFGAITTFFRQEVQPRFPLLCNMVAWPEQRSRMLLPAWLAAMGFTVQALPAASKHAHGWNAAVFYCQPERNKSVFL